MGRCHPLQKGCNSRSSFIFILQNAKEKTNNVHVCTYSWCCTHCALLCCECHPLTVLSVLIPPSRQYMLQENAIGSCCAINSNICEIENVNPNCPNWCNLAVHWLSDNTEKSHRKRFQSHRRLFSHRQL